MARHHTKLETCPNCGTSLGANDNFCPNCGQENHGLKVPFSHLLSELIETFFHFETKFFTTLKIIFTRPGQITRDFWDGKRARYMHPFRLYLFVSVIFFLVANKVSDRFVENVKERISVIERHDSVKIVELNDLMMTANKSYDHSFLKKSGLDEVADINIYLPRDSVERRNFMVGLKNAHDNILDSALINNQQPNTVENRKKLRYALSLIPDAIYIPIHWESGPLEIYFKSPEEKEAFRKNLKNYSNGELDSVLLSMKQTPGFSNRIILKMLSRLDKDDEYMLQDLHHVIFKNISVIMFVLMPVVAFLLLLAFRRQNRYYFEHLIFAIHAHTVFFILFALSLFVDYLIPFRSLVYVIVILLNWMYFFLSLKKVYQRSWLATLLKFFLLTFVYLILLAISLQAAVIWGILII